MFTFCDQPQQGSPSLSPIIQSQEFQQHKQGIPNFVLSKKLSTLGQPKKQKKYTVWERLGRRSSSASVIYDPYASKGRISRAFREFDQEQDWLTALLLQHYLAAIIQARWRGVVARKKHKKQMESIKNQNQEYLKQLKQTPFQRGEQQLDRRSNEISSPTKIIGIIKKMRGTNSESTAAETDLSDWSDMDEYEMDALKMRPASPPWNASDIDATQSVLNKLSQQKNQKLEQFDKESITERLSMAKNVRENSTSQSTVPSQKEEITGPSKDMIEQMLFQKFNEKSARLRDIETNSHLPS